MAALSRLLGLRANERGETAAFIVGADGARLSWRGLAEQADAVTALRLTRALPARSRLGIAVADPLAFTASYLGALAAGLTAVPLDPRLTPAELAGNVARLKVDVLLTDDEADTDVPVEMWTVTPAGPKLARPGIGRRPSELAALRPAVLLASSGTTGAPKGIPLTEWQLLAAARRVARHHGFGPDQRGYTPLPLFHVNAQVMGLLATVVSGASLVLDRRFEPTEYWARVAEWSPTWLNAVPAILAALIEQPAPADVAGIRFARSASAPLSAAVLRGFAEHTGVSVLETYGMTEAAGQITANPVDTRARRAGSVGLPVGVGLIVLTVSDGQRGQGTPVEAGVEGMVALRGRQIAHSYLDLSADGPERIRTARDADGWLRTGDLGSRDADGFVRLAGRSDDVINRGGEKIHPKEVEDVLLADPRVRSAAVVGAPHERLGQVAVAFVTARPGSDEADLRRALNLLCERQLTRYKRPTSIEVTGDLPRGPTGKILRRALRAELAGAAR